MARRTIRAFIAIHLPKDAKAYLSAISLEFAEKVPPRAIRWFQLDGMHITLRVLVETEIMVLPERQREHDHSADQ